MGLIHEFVKVEKPGDKESFRKALMGLSADVCAWIEKGCPESKTETRAEYYSRIYVDEVARGNKTEDEAINEYVETLRKSDLKHFVYCSVYTAKDSRGKVKMISFAMDINGC